MVGSRRRVTTGSQQSVPYHQGHGTVEHVSQPTPRHANPAVSHVEQDMHDLREEFGKLRTLLTESFTQTPAQRDALIESAAIAREAREAEASQIGFFHSKTWKIGKWAGGILAGSAATIFAAGVTYAQFQGGNATKGDVNGAVEKAVAIHNADFGQLSKEVAINTKDLGEVKNGVGTLLNRATAENDVAEKARIVEAYRREYELDFAEYTAQKAAGRRGKRPTKRPELIQAELDLAKAQDILQSVR